MSDQQCDVAIIGAGIVGLAVGLQLVRKYRGIRLVVLEKEKEIAAHQTSHNSGVLHSGLYYKPGSLKARLCVEGQADLVRFCEEHNIPHSICGKVVVATEVREIPALEELLRRGRSNELRGIRDLSAEEVKELEPNAAGIRGIYVPTTGITDFKQVAAKYAECIRDEGGEVLTHSGVEIIVSKPDAIVLETASGTVQTRFAINCAGLQSDRIVRMAGLNLGLRIVPFRGEYYELVPAKRNLIKGLIYPVPDPKFPFLGVHFTRRIDGGVEAGPNAVFSFKREGYARTSFDLNDAASSFLFGGFWKMATQNWKSGFGEFYRSYSKAAFTRSLQKLLPVLTMQDIQPGGSGVRAQAMDRSGKLVDDFYFARQDRLLHVCNVPSPAATASLAIGREIVSQLAGYEYFQQFHPAAVHPAHSSV
jgi:(S)-2-hydroxyglutarate dehydrogenase